MKSSLVRSFWVISLVYILKKTICIIGLGCRPVWLGGRSGHGFNRLSTFDLDWNLYIYLLSHVLNSDQFTNRILAMDIKFGFRQSFRFLRILEMKITTGLSNPTSFTNHTLDMNMAFQLGQSFCLADCQNRNTIDVYNHPLNSDSLYQWCPRHCLTHIQSPDAFNAIFLCILPLAVNWIEEAYPNPMSCSWT